MQYKLYYVMGIEGDDLLISAHDLEKSSKIRLKRSEAPEGIKKGDFIDVIKDDTGKTHMAICPAKREMFHLIFKVNNNIKEIDEESRFEFEKFALDNALFIPVDFELARKYDPNNLKSFTKADSMLFSEMVRAYVEDNGLKSENLPNNFLDKLFKVLDPNLAIQLEYNHSCYNAKVLDQLQEIEKFHGVKLLKHISYEQMFAIYVDGTADKSCLKPNTNPPEGEKYATTAQMENRVVEFAGQRNMWIELLREPDSFGVE